MNRPEKHTILVVDDEPSVRNSVAMILRASGHEVSTAIDGFDALMQMRRTVPDIIISDLNMPQMSGFEFLSVVRRRFPEISVIASSGAYQDGENIPGGVVADAFYSKGRNDPEGMLRIVADLIETKAARAASRNRLSAPVWIPRNGKDSNGVPFIVVTCTECLRSFPLSITTENLQAIQETPCLFCATPVRYIIDFSRSVSSPAKATSAA